MGEEEGSGPLSPPPGGAALVSHAHSGPAHPFAEPTPAPSSPRTSSPPSHQQLQPKPALFLHHKPGVGHDAATSPPEGALDPTVTGLRCGCASSPQP